MNTPQAPVKPTIIRQPLDGAGNPRLSRARRRLDFDESDDSDE